MIFDDFLDFFEILNKHQVKYVLVGGLAVVVNGFFRTTKDMDLFIEPSVENAEKLIESVNDFGFGYLSLNVDDVLDKKGYLQLGVAPVRIDMFCSLPALEFDEVYKQSFLYDQERVHFRVIHINHLIQNKEAVGRSQDITDVRNLKKIVNKGNKKL
ncbi:MAG: nucleotidyltransferase [Ferruginibacter sp.]|nr:nucleotidyltransferase [Ferruginibacter sp.]